MAFTIKGEKELIRQLRRAQEQVLPDLAHEVDAAAANAIGLARSQVSANPELGSTSFRTSVSVDKRDRVASAVVGFNHDEAAFFHEGFFFGAPEVPFRFLRKAANKAKSKFRRALIPALNESLARIFRTKE